MRCFRGNTPGADVEHLVTTAGRYNFTAWREEVEVAVRVASQLEPPFVHCPVMLKASGPTTAQCKLA